MSFYRYIFSAKVFHIRVHIHFVKRAILFHMLKTPLKVFKNQAFAPTFRVEFHTFHRVFNREEIFRAEAAVLFVKFKSEI